MAVIGNLPAPLLKSLTLKKSIKEEIIEIRIPAAFINQGKDFFMPFLSKGKESLTKRIGSSIQNAKMYNPVITFLRNGLNCFLLSIVIYQAVRAIDIPLPACLVSAIDGM